MKKIVYLLIAIVAVGCSNQEKKSADGGWDVTISGKVNFPQQGKVGIEELTPDNNPRTDSLTVDADGSFKKTMHLTQPGIYRLNFYGIQMVDVVLDSSDLTINLDGNNANGAFQVIGSPDYDVIREVQDKLQAFQQSPAMRQLEANYQQAVASKDEAKISEFQDQYMELHYSAYDSIAKDLESKPATLGLINLLEGRIFDDKGRYYSLYKKVADEAMAKWPTSVHVKMFNEMVTPMAITAIGMKAPEISLPDPNGKVVTLSSLKGKYVLVDFWAFWCGPCRKENPNVVKAYNKFKGENFEIYGVSLDRDKNQWLSAIKQDGLTWIHVSDLKYFESQAAADYNITAIPFSILVDPDGIIIGRNLRGGALHKKLAEVLNKKS